MKAFIIKQLKERAIIRGKQRTWISSCSGEQLYEVYLRLRNGDSARSISKDIQEKWKINGQSGLHSLSQGVLKYRSRIKDLLELEMGEGSAQALDETDSVENDYLDDLLGLERLLQLHRKRVEAMLKKELEGGIRDLGLCKELQALAVLMKTLTKEREFVLRHPEFDPVKKRREQLREERIKKNFDTFMENTSEESVERLLAATDRFLDLAVKQAITMIPERDENGKIRYKVVE